MAFDLKLSKLSIRKRKFYEFKMNLFVIVLVNCVYSSKLPVLLECSKRNSSDLYCFYPVGFRWSQNKLICLYTEDGTGETFQSWNTHTHYLFRTIESFGIAHLQIEKKEHFIKLSLNIFLIRQLKIEFSDSIQME